MTHRKRRSHIRSSKKQFVRKASEALTVCVGFATFTVRVRAKIWLSPFVCLFARVLKYGEKRSGIKCAPFRQPNVDLVGEQYHATMRTSTRATGESNS